MVFQEAVEAPISASGQHLRLRGWKPWLTPDLPSKGVPKSGGAPFWRRVGTSNGKELQGLRGKDGAVWVESNPLVEELRDCGFWNLSTIFRATITKII